VGPTLLIFLQKEERSYAYFSDSISGLHVTAEVVLVSLNLTNSYVRHVRVTDGRTLCSAEAEYSSVGWYSYNVS
jgi:hypothetical protein